LSPDYHPIIVYQYCEVDFTNKLRLNLYYIIFKLINIYDKKMYIMNKMNEKKIILTNWDNQFFFITLGLRTHMYS